MVHELHVSKLSIWTGRKALCHNGLPQSVAVVEVQVHIFCRLPIGADVGNRRQ